MDASIDERIGEFAWDTTIVDAFGLKTTELGFLAWQQDSVAAFPKTVYLPIEAEDSESSEILQLSLHTLRLVETLAVRVYPLMEDGSFGPTPIVAELMGSLPIEVPATIHLEVNVSAETSTDLFSIVAQARLRGSLPTDAPLSVREVVFRVRSE
ncbi:MAG: hypothetical protein AAFY15_15900 [Cyanobacteria bacterium J06648_11]